MALEKGGNWLKQEGTAIRSFLLGYIKSVFITWLAYAF